jgi:uncharacterized protein YpiB (UPF0302 family)
VIKESRSVGMEHKVLQLYKKKGYIKWFLNRNLLKDPQTAKILIHILENEELLDKVRFIEDLRPYETALLISSEDAKTVSFLLRIEDSYYEDIDMFIEDLSKKEIEALYIWLSFDREFLCSACSGVLYESPEVKFKKQAQSLIYKLENEIISNITKKDKLRKEILLKIDNALVEGKVDEFFQLTERLREFEF